MRWAKGAVCTVFMVFLFSGSAQAYTLPVFDYTSFAKQLIQYLTQVQQYYTQLQQYSTQMKQLETMQANLENLDYQSDLSNLDEMRAVMNSADGISNNFTNMQTQFNEHYPEFTAYQNQRGVDYARQSQEWSRINQKNAHDMLVMTTRLRESIEQDQDNLKYLSNRSSKASGTRDLLQATNQILIVNTKQLMQLQQLLQASLKAQAAFLAEKAAHDEALQAETKRSYNNWVEPGHHRPAPKPGHVLR